LPLAMSIREGKGFQKKKGESRAERPGRKQGEKLAAKKDGDPSFSSQLKLWNFTRKGGGEETHTPGKKKIRCGGVPRRYLSGVTIFC